ncbi:ParB/RepB/Spo0J family partition protein [Streptomyces sp. rh34]|uniref:ParB/RepB/Spo0J family partition protein n=1 Tax=Streptomyces sp. rh34 TaxID=2034272 RepID=UPI000BEFA50F|nr:ParB N-terminal domain-containing protein [Streptomyces sp. rh34]
MAMNPNEFDDFLEDDDAPDHVIDTRADGRLLRVPLGRISPNLVNPRKDFGTEDDLKDFGRSLKRRQIQAVPVVTRKAYLNLWPDHKDGIGNVDVVIVSGERRYRGASAVDLPALECVINDGYAESRKTFLDAVVSENIDRQNFDAIEEANAVEVLVEAFGTARAVAEHYERVDGWVSQRRILLRLAPEAQELVRRQSMPLDAARKLGKLVKDYQWSASDQLQWWEDEQQERAKKAAAKKAARAAERKAAAQAAPMPPSFTAVKPVGVAPAPDPGIPQRVEPEQSSPAPTPDPAPAALPVQRETAPSPTPTPSEAPLNVATPAVRPTGPIRQSVAAEPSVRVQQLPTHDWQQLADIVIAELPRAALQNLTERLLEAATSRSA